MASLKSLHPYQENSVWARFRQTERRQWWLWATAILVTLLLTAGMASFSYLFEQSDPAFSNSLRESIRGLVALVFLFDLYTIYQQLQIQRIRRQLTEREEMFSLISENAEDLIAVVDRNGKRLYNSPSYSRLFGYTNEELQGVPVLEQVHPDDRQRMIEAREGVFRNGSPPRLEYRFRRKDGEWRILESAASPVKNSHGETVKLIIVSRDITERKQAEELLRRREEQLRQAQKMEAVGRLSGGIAHDFNNLLGVIIGYSEAMELRLAQDDPLRKSAEEVRKAGERAAALTRQLLAFSRQQVLQPKVLDLNSVVADMDKMLRRLIGAHIEISTKLAPDLGHVTADQSLIEQVIVNLIVNARDAMPEGGKLVIETQNIALDEELARSLPFLHPGPHVLLTVSDTGVGMDLETLGHIFEPFFTTKERGRGTGLGLATVYGAIKQSGGIVGVHSEPGLGTKFKIYLPQVEQPLTIVASNASVANALTGSETVLLVEDEHALLELTADLLAHSGYKILSAHDGVEALEIARSFQGPIHLLLTDVVMPRLGGLALAKHMVELRPGIRTIFMTGHGGADASLQVNLTPGAELLQKPFNQNTLVQKVRQTLDLAEMQMHD